nr:hypothetical protein [Brevundimonas bacteroides]
MQVDALDQLAKLVADLFAFIALKGLVKTRGQLRVGLCRGRMQGHRLRLIDLGEKGMKLGAPGLQRSTTALQFLDLHSSIDAQGLGAFELACDLGQLPLHRGPGRQGLSPAVLALLAQLIDGSGHGLRRQQLVADAVQHARLDRWRSDDLLVRAGAALTRRAAGVLVAVQGHARTAQAALEQSGQKAFGPSGLLGRLICQGLLPGLGRSPQRIVDDAQFGRGFADPFRLGIEDGRAPARVRVLPELAPVEDPDADIELLTQDAILRPPVAVDGRGGPLSAARTRHALAVESVRDQAGRLAGGVVGENPADDFGLLLVDIQKPALIVCATRHPIAVAATTARAARLHPRQQATTGLLAELDQEHLVHRSGQTDVELGDAAFRDRLQRRAVEGQPLVEVGGALLIPRKTIQRLGEDDVEGPALGAPEELLHTRPIRQVGARDAEVREFLDH